MLSDLERSKSRSLGFQSLISHNGAKLGHMLILNIIANHISGSPMTPSHFDLVWQGRSEIEWQEICIDLQWQEICTVYIYLPAIITCTTLIWTSEISLLVGGAFHCPSGLCFILYWKSCIADVMCRALLKILDFWSLHSTPPPHPPHPQHTPPLLPAIKPVDKSCFVFQSAGCPNLCSD